MTNIVLLVVCLLAGMALRRSGRAPEGAHLGINAFIVHLALPALVLGHLHGVRPSAELVLPILMPWLLFAASAGTFALLARGLGLDAGTTGALILSAGLANTSFVGLPMIEAFYGRQHLATGIVIDQLGTYLVLSTLGIVVACLCSKEQASGRSILRRIASFPPLIALVLALVTAGIATRTLAVPRCSTGSATRWPRSPSSPSGCKSASRSSPASAARSGSASPSSSSPPRSCWRSSISEHSPSRGRRRA